MTALVRVLLGVTLLVPVTAAGACRRDHAGPLPSPDDAGAAPLPSGLSGTGLTATYARLTSDRGDGSRCFHLVRLLPGGHAELGQGCSPDGPEAVAVDEQAWSGQPRSGDYGYASGALALRIVGWDPLAEEIVVEEHTATYCADQLDVRATDGGAMRTYQLVAGTAPPDAVPC